LNLNANRKENRSAIDRHLERTSEMLLHNAQFWIEGSGLVSEEAGKINKVTQVKY
jgi:hypothetical protein